MSAQFENSRCAELVAAASARAAGKGYALKDAPGDIKALVILTTKQRLLQLCPQLMFTPEGKEVLDGFNKMLVALSPDIFEPGENGRPSTYQRVSKIFFSDLSDLAHGNLDNPPV